MNVSLVKRIASRPEIDKCHRGNLRYNTIHRVLEGYDFLSAFRVFHLLDCHGEGVILQFACANCVLEDEPRVSDQSVEVCRGHVLTPMFLGSIHKAMGKRRVLLAVPAEAPNTKTTV